MDRQVKDTRVLYYFNYRDSWVIETTSRGEQADDILEIGTRLCSINQIAVDIGTGILPLGLAGILLSLS